jgi:hypothetical protein
MTKIIEALAISYSDGSYNVMTNTDNLEKARSECDFADHKENNPEHLSNIVRVRLEVLEVVEQRRPKVTP